MFSIRNANPKDIAEIERMISAFVKGHPAENYPRSQETLRAAYFEERPVAHLLVAERNGEIVGMVQWSLIHNMFWGMFGAEAGWLYVKPDHRGSGIVAALVARICALASEAGAKFLQGSGDEGPSKLYERVAIGLPDRTCHISGKAFQTIAELDGLPLREIVRRLPAKELGLEPAES